MKGYEERIRQELARIGRVGMNPGQVEAFMRLEHPTLDGLSKRQFDYEVRIGAHCVEEAGPEQSARLAESFGL